MKLNIESYLRALAWPQDLSSRKTTATGQNNFSAYSPFLALDSPIREVDTLRIKEM